MGQSLLISNSLNRQVDIYYRVKASDGSMMPMIKVSIQSRALCNEIAFASEEHKNAFLAQAKYLIDKGILILGKTTEEKLVNNNVTLKEAETEEKKVNTEKILDKIEEAADKIDASMTIKAEPVTKQKNTKKSK